ncbi:hypothetical protein CSPX01_15070 [Colletotrichum filicis]|nr:hypothetical protein CSPX01_15070 [Colletotrichum filicis]
MIVALFTKTRLKHGIFILELRSYGWRFIRYADATSVVAMTNIYSQLKDDHLEEHLKKRAAKLGYIGHPVDGDAATNTAIGPFVADE